MIPVLTKGVPWQQDAFTQTNNIPFGLDPSSQVGFTSSSSHFGLPWDRLHGGPVIYLIVECFQDSCQDCCQECCPGTGYTVGLWYIWLLIVVKVVAKNVAPGPAARWACEIFSFPSVIFWLGHLVLRASCDSLHSMRWENWSPKLFRFRGDPSPQTGCFAGDEPLQYDILTTCDLWLILYISK